MSRSAASRVAFVVFVLTVAVLAACTSGSSSSSCGCRPPCGCGPSGTYGYGPASPAYGQPMPAPMPAAPQGSSYGYGPPTAAAPPATIGDQVERGRAAFARSCAMCHGGAGEGTDKAPALVGAGALPLDPPPTRQVRKMQFRTLGDVAQFAIANMPPSGKGEKPPPDDLWAIVAFVADRNGARPSEVLTPANASTIVLHK